MPRTQILVYDGSGAFHEAWGRQGSGPGEYQAIVRLVRVANDSLAVIDAGTRRVSILSPSGRFARAFTSTLPLTDLVSLAGGVWAVAGMAFDSKAGQPLHIIAPDGSMIASFGGPLTPQPGRLAATTRVIARDSSGRGIWSASPVRYEIERWTESAQRTHLLERDASWFPHADVVARNAWSFPIFPRLRALHSDSRGLLWTLAVVPKNGWKPSIQNYGGIEVDHLNYDTVVEVIDPAAGRLIASQRFPWVGWKFADGGIVVAYRQTPTGILAVDIWQMDLVGLARR